MAKLDVMCARSMHQAVDALAGKFQRESGHTVAIEFGTVGALQDRIDAGGKADVLILSAPMIKKLEQGGSLVPDGAAAIARTSIGIAIREGSPAPDVSTPDAFKQALSAAGAVAFSDPAVGGSAGVYLARLLGEIGLAEAMARKGLPQKNGGEVARRVAEGKADLGMTLIAEIMPIAGVRVIGKLPPPLGLDTTYWAGISGTCTDIAAARGFIAALRAPASREIWQAAGFELPGG